MSTRNPKESKPRANDGTEGKKAGSSRVKTSGTDLERKPQPGGATVLMPKTSEQHAFHATPEDDKPKKRKPASASKRIRQAAPVTKDWPFPFGLNP